MAKIEDGGKGGLVIRAVMDEKYYTNVPTVDVNVAILNSSKNISKVVKKLNEILPVPRLQHLKRVKKFEGRFFVILDFVRNEEREKEQDVENEKNTISRKRPKLDESMYLQKLKTKGVNCEELGIDGVETCQVPKEGPKTRAQYEKSMQLWPVNFHPEKKVEAMLSDTIFDDAERMHHLNSMQQVLKMANERQKNVALVVDFKSGQTIAMGYDRTEHHPLQHAVMVAVDAVASTQNGGAWDLPFDELKPSKESTPSRKDELPEGNPDSCKAFDDQAPYLCTGCDLYVEREPCVMCAMSLIHSRIARVFFHVRDAARGALVSRCQIHTIRDLNHHYEVFEIVKI
ncbi:hypothetical protein RUM43_012851 [Polyplax serrata]|uniref:CMP/dCMP-type deaminase domain-containing protein n=1 Tax=Polyplax serrata TaxID=468196 RepID=A0AAN8P5P2_POLSC